MRVAAVLVVGLSFVSLARAGELAGVVFREDGEPAAGATVNAAAVFHSPPARFSTQTDDRGMFRFDLPPLHNSERYYLAVRWRSQGAEFRKAVGADANPADIQGQELPLQSIRLHAAGVLWPNGDGPWLPTWIA